MTQLTPFLKDLLSCSGLSAYEAPVRDVISATWRPLVDDLTVSKMGSLHGFRRGSGAEPRPRIMLAAHMDAIGLMVTKIVEGFLYFTEVGGVDPRILPGQSVIVHGRRELPGVVVQPAPALLPPEFASKPVAMKYLMVDIGLLPEEVNQVVRPGDLISFALPPQEMPGGNIAGHSLDNRASVAAITQTLDELQHMKPVWDVWAVATTQEEVTFAGAYSSPFTIRPDMAIVIDVTFAKGPGASDYRTFPLGKGISLGLGPNIHPALHNNAKELCEKLDIPYNIEPMPRHSGTDAYAVQVVAEGIPSMVISIPLRYMHTPVEMVNLKDITRAGHFMAEFIARMDADFMQNINWEG